MKEKVCKNCVKRVNKVCTINKIFIARKHKACDKFKTK